MFKALTAVLLLASAVPAMATTLVLGSGWQDDEVGAENTNSNLSPWTFTLTSASLFIVTDAYIVGDIYHLTDAANSIDVFTTFTTDGNAVSDYADVSWSDLSYSRIALALGAGSYSISIRGNCAGGCPAGFGVRLDAAANAPTVPEPATWALMIAGFGMVGTALRRRTAVTA